MAIRDAAVLRARPEMNLPNLLSCCRIACGPLFILCFVGPFGWIGKLLALMLALAIEATDILDGRIARRRNLVTDLGRFLDPFADSVSRASVFLAFMAVGIAEVWMLALIVYRDTMVAYVRIWSMRRGTVQAARISGKIKAVVQGAAIHVVCAGALAAALGWRPDLVHRVSWWIVAAVSVITAASGIEYAVGLKKGAAVGAKDQQEDREQEEVGS